MTTGRDRLRPGRWSAYVSVALFGACGILAALSGNVPAAILAIVVLFYIWTEDNSMWLIQALFELTDALEQRIKQLEMEAGDDHIRTLKSVMENTFPPGVDVE